MKSWLTHLFGFWKKKSSKEYSYPLPKHKFGYFSQGLKGSKISPYRVAEVLNSISSATHCSRCFTSINAEEDKERIFIPCPYGAPRPGPLCGICTGIWVEENPTYCQPYAELGIKIPIYELEIYPSGIKASSMPFEWFYPDLKPGKGPWQ